MKKGWAWAAAGMVLAGCGGGDDGDKGSPAPVVQQPAPPPPVTVAPPPPPPTVTLVSGTITRQVAANTNIAMEVIVKPSFTPAGALYASAPESPALLLPTVAVSPNSDGTYTLALATVASVPAGAHAGEFTVKLCADAACATPQAVPSIKVPYAITATASGSAWPGDKITPLAPWENVPDWSTFQGNAGHTGYVPVTLNPDQFSLRWKAGSIAAMAYNGQAGAMTLAAANGIFYAAKDKKLEARKELDGSVVWSYDVSTLAYPSVNPPAVDKGVVYMAAGQQSSTFMFAFDAASGNVIFKSPMSSQWERYLAPVAYEDAVYTNAGMYGGAYAIKTSGELMFTASAAQTDSWSPAVDANSMYVFARNLLSVYDRKTGAERFKISDPASSGNGFGVGGAPVLTSPGMLVVAEYNGASWSGAKNTLLKFNVDKGYVDWRVEGAYPVTPAYADGVLYAPNKAPYRLEARSESDAALRWQWTPPIAGETTWSAEPVVTRNMVFVSTDKNTYAIDLRTGKAVWSYPLAGRLALTRSGILYIHSIEALVAINVK